jgi:hypothetical protein
VTFVRRCWFWQLRDTFVEARSDRRCGGSPFQGVFRKTEFKALAEEAFLPLEVSASRSKGLP